MKMPMSLYTKIYLKFPRKFWDDKEYILVASSKRRGYYPVLQVCLEHEYNIKIIEGGREEWMEGRRGRNRGRKGGIEGSRSEETKGKRDGWMNGWINRKNEKGR